MYFTQEDYLKIQDWLQRNSVRDTEFQEANLPLRGDEIAAIIQDGKNKKLLLKELKGQSSIKLVLDDEETFSLEGGHEALINDSRKQALINILEEAVQDNSLSKLSDTIHVVFTRNGVTYRTFSSTKGEFGNDYNHIQLTCTSLYSKDNVFYVGVVYLYYTLGSSYISVDGFEESPINTENISLSLYRVVDSLPSKPDSDDINKIHLVKTSRTDENDRFDEYLWKGDTWELIGTLKNEIDLSDYYTKTETEDLCDSKINGLSSSPNDGDLVNVKVIQEQGKISTIVVDESKLINNLPVVIPFSALTSDNGVTIWNKLQFALENSMPLFISYWVGSNQEYTLVPINAKYVGQGRYVISYTIPNYNSVFDNIISHTTYTIGIGDGGYLDNAWSRRTSLCAVPITQAEYDALTTKEDVLYVIKG